MKNLIERLAKLTEWIGPKKISQGTIEDIKRIGAHRIRFTPDSPRDLKFLLGSIKERERMDPEQRLEIKEPDVVIVEGTSYALRVFVESMLKSNFEGTVEIE